MNELSRTDGIEEAIDWTGHTHACFDVQSDD